MALMTGHKTGNSLRDAESFMYDREPRFPMLDTRNAARMEYTMNGMSHVASNRCDITKISKCQAVISLPTRFNFPQDFYLDLPDARIAKIGCKVIKAYPNNTLEVRFLRGLSDKELNRIYFYSTHPAHKDVKLDIRA